jgi:hypothetical protein
MAKSKVPLMSLPVTLVAKLGRITQHTKEYFSPTGHHFDRVALEQLLHDPEVTTFLTSHAAFFPVTRHG